MKKNIIPIICVINFIALFFLFFSNLFSVKKVAYVRSNELVYGYQGMKEAHAVQEEKSKQFKSNIDTLQMDLQKVIAQYNSEYATLSPKERTEKEKLISIQQQNFQQYAENAENSIKQNDLDLTEGVLNQINTLVEKYAKENNYQIIFGTTSSGNILYGDKEIDITEPVLKYINSNYSTKSDSLK